MAHLRRTREVGGPGLTGPAIVVPQATYRPHPEHRILARRADIERRRVFEDMAKDDEFVNKRIQFETRGDARIKANTIQRRVQEIKLQESSKLEERRAKLKALLEEEERAFLDEAVSKTETVLDKQAKLRERAKALRERREAERASFAQEMLEKAWKDNCEPLRAQATQQTKQSIAVDLKLQMEEKHFLLEQEKEYEQFYAECEELDRLAKEARDESDIKNLNKGAAENVKFLDAQIKLLEDNRKEEMKLREEEKRLRLEHEALVQEEEQAERKAIMDKKLKVKAMLDADMEERTKYNEARMKETMAADLKLLEQLQAQMEEDDRGDQERKQRLAQESKQYMEYLQSLKATQDELNAQVEEAMQEIKKEVWKKETARWRMEKQKRNELMKEVNEVLHEQIASKRREIDDERRKIHEEGLELASKVAELNKQAEEEEKKQLEANRNYGTHLTAQIQFQRQKRQDEIEADKKLVRDIAAQNQAEEARIARALKEQRDMGLSITGSRFN
eukprot:m.71166 g.71166  ORF g.71166 m.71166 type:complete len:506 (+) comp12219_c0_seq1:184-1701(+)